MSEWIRVTPNAVPVLAGLPEPAKPPQLDVPESMAINLAHVIYAYNDGTATTIVFSNGQSVPIDEVYSRFIDMVQRYGTTHYASAR
jgi:hypothetical protein